MSKLSVTCSIVLHKEGLCVHTALCSIARARVFAESEGFSVELLIILDDSDSFTERLVRRHPAVRPGDLVESVAFGDPGLLRNYAVVRASGRYLLIMDGGGYYSENFIAVLAREAARDENSAVYPEYLFNVDDGPGYTRLGGPVDLAENSYALFSSHHYCSVVAAYREVFRLVPYGARTDGFGSEDWHWCCEARAAGVRQRIASETVFFHRAVPENPATPHAKESVLIPPSNFFRTLPEPEGILSSRLPAMPPPSLPWKSLAKELLISLLGKMPERLATPLYARLRRRFGAAKPAQYPPVIRKALLETAAIDGMLHPDFMPPAPFHEPRYDLLPGKAYARAWHALPHHEYDVVYTVPRVQVGGADLMAVNYMKAARESGRRVLYITTEDSAGDFSRIPEGVVGLDFGGLSASLRHEQKQRVLARLLIELGPVVIHTVNDWFCFELFTIHGAALKTRSRLVASIFGDAQDDQDIRYGAGTRYLRALFPYCAKIITDNRVTAEEWSARLGLPADYFAPVYGIMPLQREKGRREEAGREEAEPRRVLWAGRLDKEKRLDVLLAIAQGAPDLYFDVYGKVVLDADPLLSTLEKQPNIRLCGAYGDFFALPAERYFALVYTTQNDGLPNVLLEATAVGLPVVAPDRGGIRDFITNETGWLIPRHTDIQAYVNALRAIRDNAPEAGARWKRARVLLEKRHSEAVFVHDLFAAYGIDVDMAHR